MEEVLGSSNLTDDRKMIYVNFTWIIQTREIVLQFIKKTNR